MTRHTKHLRTSVAAFAVAALALVGCEADDGGGTDDLSEPDTGGETTEPDTGGETTEPDTGGTDGAETTEPDTSG